MLLSIEGEESCGKTTLAYTAPLKIVGFSFDTGAERALYGSKHEAYFAGVKIEIVTYTGKAVVKWADNDITIYEMPTPIQLDDVKVAGCRELWNVFLVLVAKAMEDPLVRSIAIDTMTAARRIKADAYLQALQADKPRERLTQIEYAAPNGAIRDLYNATKGKHKNLLAIHTLTDERKDRVNPKDGSIEKGVVTGNRTVEGLDPKYLVDATIRMEKKGHTLSGLIRKCGDNISLEGMSLADPTWDKFVTMIEVSLGGRIKFERRNSA